MSEHRYEEADYIDASAAARAEAYRKRKNTAVLAIVFTDIADSTRLREEYGERRYEELREEFDKQFEQIIVGDDAGAVIKGNGDGALAVFAEPSTAVERCLEVQRALGPHVFKLRIGIDMGQVALKSALGLVRDVFGRHVNRAARVQALAQPGHILTSYHVYDCAVGWLKDKGVSWHNHGVTALKGFADEVSIHEPLRGLMPQERTALTRGPASDQSKNHLRGIVPPAFVEGEDPELALKRSIASTVQFLSAFIPGQIHAFWFSPSLKRSIDLTPLLNDAGFKGVTWSRSTETPEEFVAGIPHRYNYLLTVVLIESTETAHISLAFIRKLAQHKHPVPILVYASPSTLGSYEAEARSAGCVFYTGGSVSLMHGIYQVLARLRVEMQVESLDGILSGVPVTPGHLQRIRDILAEIGRDKGRLARPRHYHQT